MGRSSQRYCAVPDPNQGLRQRLKELAEVRRRFGYRRLHILLLREGLKINRKRVERLYREEGLSLRNKRRRKRYAGLRVIQPAPSKPQQRWSMDFMADQLMDGRRLRLLNIVDDFSRECIAIEADRSLTGHRVVSVLERIAQTRGLPESIVCDNGTEFTSRVLDDWAHRFGLKLQFIRPGKPVENAFIESFNGKCRDECLNEHLFFSIEDARNKLEAWREDYNRLRPHSALGNLTPEAFAQQHRVRTTQNQSDMRLSLA